MDQTLSNNYEHWVLKIDEDEVLWLGFDRQDSKVNSLNEATLKEFSAILTNVKNNSKIRGLIIYSLKKSGFIAGADIAQFKNFTSADEATQLISKGQEIFNQLEDLVIPTVAMIEGFCLGGGLELALACKYRIAENSLKTRLGLPEVKLGIHPGWGGTVRLPEIAGPMVAMDLILSGRLVTANYAKKVGIINEAVPVRLLIQVAKQYSLNPPAIRNKLPLNQLMNSSIVRPLLARLFYHQLANKVNIAHYPAPFKVIDNWLEGGVKQAAMLKEAQSIGNLLVSDCSKNLVRVFFLQEKLKNQAKQLEFKPLHIHVIGAGVMGGDIAAWCALKGFKVTLQDQAPKLIANAIMRAHQLAKKQLKENYLIHDMLDRLLPDKQGLGITQADVIIEAITESLQAKQDLFALIESKARPNAILATNTSTIPLEEIGTALKNPRRLVGIHFFNPVAKMPLVEIVKGISTEVMVVDQAVALVRKMDKLPLVVKSKPGFLINRILLPYMLEAMVLLEEGVSGTVIDKAAVEFGMPMGPVELADTVGLDICLAALEKLTANVNIAIPTKLKELVTRGELGKKSGKGFYQYSKGKRVKTTASSTSAPAEDVANRLMLRLLNEAIACLREGIVSDSELLDAGCIFGFGFPPFRGGPINWAKHYGYEKLDELYRQFEGRYGNRFAKDAGWQSEGLDSNSR